MELKDAILSSIAENGAVNASGIALRHGVSRQTVYRCLTELKDSNSVVCLGRNKYDFVYSRKAVKLINKGLEEETVWTQFIEPNLPTMTKNAMRAVGFCFSEMMNNAINHSESDKIDVRIKTCVYSTEIFIADFGVGIFQKICNALNLDEKRHAVLELAKGKFTTDPVSHTGEGIFFSSKVAESFIIVSDKLAFFGNYKGQLEQPVLLDNLIDEKDSFKTLVYFKIINISDFDLNTVFEKYTQQPDDYGFSKTQIPVKLLSYGEKNALLYSRSQARRLLARLDKFENIVMDFEGVEDIGQGFADEIFRVFANAHPDVRLGVINCSAAVEKMIAHVKA